MMPFCTSDIGGSLSKIRGLAPNSTVPQGFRGTVSMAKAQMKQWLDGNHFTEAVSMLLKLATAKGDMMLKLENNSAAKNLAAMMPLDFDHYSNTEKSAYPLENTAVPDTA